MVHEEVRPLAKYMLYLRPREENTWLLFFNDVVTFATLQEVFEDNFVRDKQHQNGRSFLRSPTAFFFVKKSEIGKILF